MKNNANYGCGEFYLTACSGGNRTWLLRTSPGQVESIYALELDVKRLNQGVAEQLTDREGKKHLVGFYSEHQMSSINAPDYGRSFFFFVDQQVFGNTAQEPFVRLKKGILSRTLTVTQGDEIIVKFSYFWPFFREYLIADDFDYVSKDIIYLLVSAMKYANPKWLTR